MKDEWEELLFAAWTAIMYEGSECSWVQESEADLRDAAMTLDGANPAVCALITFGEPSVRTVERHAWKSRARLIVSG